MNVNDYLEKCETIKSQYNYNLLDQLNEKIREKKLGHKDNTLDHKDILTFFEYLRIIGMSIFKLTKIKLNKKFNFSVDYALPEMH